MNPNIWLGRGTERHEGCFASGKTRRVFGLLAEGTMADEEGNVSGQIWPPKPLRDAVDGFGNAQVT